MTKRFAREMNIENEHFAEARSRKEPRRLCSAN